MYTPNGSIERWQTPIFISSGPTQPCQGPIYHVYSHYGCSSKDINRCETCKYLLQSNTYLHSNPQSLLAATESRVLPQIQRQLSPTPIKPTRHRIDDKNDLYLLPTLPGSSRTRREAEDAAIINICLKDKSIDRIVLVDADEENHPEDDDDDDVLFVRLYDLEQRSSQ
ncbi:unnamed protein product [Rotaria magnacalcarata]|uniref:Uncharacterized protein n=1 Tax=Rotaria magnacalcarata TaxID=392030 RepID=A0A819QSR4_9BILA|nr:unnamed protein product [Rotaria magnacalcarata]CAF2132468.1 unnamed protein product [Rotaria magnacalcarata]CAF3929587.1 unnamed protein product [Rotaria magnacalcarata]CAF4030174.1 unnamed protein product [Rotaria magnacalcarata]